MFGNLWRDLCCVKSNINLFIAKHMEYLTSNYTRPTIFFTGVILGIIYIWDAKISGYLKTPLARLSIKVENCEFWEDEEKDEQEKVFFLSASQENNELFKKTFEKFGIIAIPFLLVNLLDNGRLEIIKKFSNSPWFLSCYILPVLWGTWKTWLVHKRLIGLEKKAGINPEEIITPILEKYE